MTTRTFALACLVLPLLSFSVAADDDEGGSGRIGAVTHAATKAECSACHIAYQPGFLPARSWTAIMTTLADHFGEDASLPEAARADIEAYLVANAADAAGRTRGQQEGNAAAAPLRITELSWFVKEHKDEVSASMKEKAKSMANCAACHKGAESGSFEND